MDTPTLFTGSRDVDHAWRIAMGDMACFIVGILTVLRERAMTIGAYVVMSSIVSADERPWREPGQVKDAEYLRTATLRYSADDREIIGRNRTCFNNRPLYCQPHDTGFVLTGDRPLVRLIGGFQAGVWTCAIVRDGAGVWFHDCAEVESRYRCGRMAWRVSDPAVPGVETLVEVLPLNGAAGFALRLKAKGLRAGDQLIWSFGGLQPGDGPSGHWDSAARGAWDPVMCGNPNVGKTGDPRKPLTRLGFVPGACAGNKVEIDGQSFTILMKPGAPQMTVGSVDRAGSLRVADASAGADPSKLAASSGGEQPILCGVIDLRAGEDEAAWVVRVAPADAASAPSDSPAKAFADAAAYLQSVERVQTETPDPRLDAAIAAVCHATDAACDRDPTLFRHGCMSFYIHFLGWRVICGSTALGWHDRVKGNAAYYIASQVKEDNVRTQPEPDVGRRHVHEGDRSRFHGKGKIAKTVGMYNTQSQFFDQTLRDWRWTADPEMERILRPALDLQLEWARDCFDPDDDGLYESYINTLPTDSVWYNGGGSVEESAYVFYGHLAARDMARRAGDAEAAQRHQARADKIQKALREILWLKDRGHFGLYVEQGGHERVHPDTWVYSQFLPIDAGMTMPEEAIQSLYYTEWALERIRLPFGGVLCQPSNWVPSKWSVRDIFSGDVWALALAYQQTGLVDEGYDLLLGAMLETCYAGVMPGGFSHIGAGADFADCRDMFARVVVEGLFGYNPDYPNGIVRIRPALPSAWPKASIKAPDYNLAFGQDGDTETYQLRLAKEAAVEFRLPVRAEKIVRVTLDGQPAAWKTEAGFGCTHVLVRTGKPIKTATVSIGLAGRVPHAAAVPVESNVGDAVRLAAPHGQAGAWRDFHGIIEDARAERGAISGQIARKPGHHLVIADVKVGDLPQRQVFKIRVLDPKAEVDLAARTPREAPKDARWECLDLSAVVNGDVRTIYKQKYLSPRPKTCSVRIGDDGWSAWCFPYWGNNPPAIDLGNLPKLAGPDGRIRTPQNAPFAKFAEDKNIAFTSLWDNWPRSVTVPVGRSADTAWMLVAGSTFPMHLRMPNAVIRFAYADGQVETLDLVPPVNFWCLSSWGGVDYDYRTDAFALPKEPPSQVQLGKECRAMVLSWKLRPGVKLEKITLETLSQEVVIGLMGVSLMDAKD
jgi:hypothetical protein